MLAIVRSAWNLISLSPNTARFRNSWGVPIPLVVRSLLPKTPSARRGAVFAFLAIGWVNLLHAQIPPAALDSSRSDYDELYAKYSQQARAHSTLPDCPKGRDDLWTDCFGSIISPNGSRYTGEIGHVRNLPSYSPNFFFGLGFRGRIDVRGTRTGIGVYENTDRHNQGYLYFGQWLVDEKYGFGRLHLPGIGRYVGFHERDRRVGEGIEFGVGGTIRLQGRWSSDRLASVYDLDSSLFSYGDDLLIPKSLSLDKSRLQTRLVFSFESSAAIDRKDGGKSVPPRAFYMAVSASRPDDDGVVTFTITTNRDTASLKINGDEEGSRAAGRYALRRFAQVGDNRFDFVAVDRSGNKQRQTVTVSREFAQTAPTFPALNPLAVRAAKPRDAVAIVIGIERYRRVPAADFANRDASVFVDYARRALGIPTENTRLLLDDKADAAEILVAFKNWLPTRVNKGKTDVYVFYSGHGLPSEDGSSLVFLPYEANLELLDRTTIAQREIIEAIQRTNPKSVTMFIDSCYSGQSRTGETLLASARPISIVAKEASNFPENFTVISASAPDQISSSSPELRHGIFSYYLMRGMEGEADGNKDGQITVAEMQAYLAERVPRRAMGMNRTQQPQTVGDQARVLVAR